MTITEPTHQFLYASALIVSKTPTIVKTILGSCVSVCLFDKENRIGGMNHFMLPYWRGNELASPKYGNVAMKKMLEKVLFYGADMKNLKAKVFGGAEVLKTSNCHFKIGSLNIEMAKSFLRESEIPILSSDTGGNLGRKITFNTSTGDVFSKRIDSSAEPIKMIS